MPSGPRRCALALALPLLAAIASAQSPAPQSTPPAQQSTPAQPAPPQSSTPQRAQPPAALPTYSVTTREVLLDVLVTDAQGRPITGLTPADFTILEDGERQTLRRLGEHQSMSAADVARTQAAPPLPPNTFTNFTPMVNTNALTVILLDALDTPLTDQQEVREQLIAYLKNMQPGAEIAIFQLADQMRLVQGFTSDKQALLAAATGARNMPSLWRPVLGNRELYRESRHAVVRAGMEAMGRYLSGFPGRKSLIWFTADLPLYTGQNPLSLIGSGHAYPFKDSFALVGDSPDEPNTLADEQALSRVAVYPIDSRGLQGGDLMARMAKDIYNLETVAQATGGQAFFNMNGFREIIAQVVNNSSYYYSLSYTPSNQSWNGDFRHIKVTVDRPGARVQNREGYYAYNRNEQEQKQVVSYAERAARAAAREETVSTTQSSGLPGQPEQPGALVKTPHGGFQAAMLLGAIPPTEIVFTASLAPGDQVTKLKKNQPLPQGSYLEADWRDKPFRTDTILYKADMHHIHVTQTPDGIRHGSVEFVTILYAQDGQPVNSLRSVATLDLDDAAWRNLRRSGLTDRQQIAVPVKGNYFLRVGVHDIISDHIGALEIPVDQIRLGIAGQGLP